MLSILALTAAVLAQTGHAPAHSPVPQDREPAEFAVHEWGAFTSFSGPDGRVIPFRSRIAEDLPAFVHARIIGDRWLPADAQEFTREVLLAAQRMEAPVIYFHIPRPMEVRVEVSFPAGLITEVYPPVSAYTPPKLAEQAIPPGGSSVTWEKVRIVPYVCCDFLEFKNAGKSHYAHARLTEGDGVHVEHNGEKHDERFLFYGGVGNPELGVRVRALGEGRLVLDSTLPGPFNAFTIENLDGVLRFGSHQDLKPGDQVSIPKSPAKQEALETEVRDALIRAGLNRDEAFAMVATWKHQWFGEQGTRMLVILPQSLIDSALPLSITPTPDKTTRVFVSRLEVLTPERRAWLEGVVRKHESNPDAPEFWAEVKPLGRFRDAALQLVREKPVVTRKGG
jgi:hypothetical protein